MEDRKMAEEEMFQRLAPSMYPKMKAARVAVAGLGGLGSRIALDLARTGIGFLHLIDFDVVEPSNLNRQQYRISHLGMKKTEALEQEIREINPFVQVKTECIRVDQDNVARLFWEDDIVCEAFDDPEAKALLVDVVLGEYHDKTIVAASGMAGYGSANEIRTQKAFGRLYICGDFQSDAAKENGMMAPRVAICAGHQTNMIVRLIMGEMGE